MSERVKEAAQMAVLGLDPFRFLETRDHQERALMILLSNELVELDKVRTSNLAVEIANKVGQLFKK